MINSIHIDLLGTETRFVKSRDYLTRVIEVHNDRPPLILLHGGGGHAETFSRNLNTLAEVCRPIAMDFIWHGMSSRPPFSDGAAGDDVHWLRQFTLQVLGLMEALGLESASFEGESLGGWVALDLAINFPEKVDAIVLNTAWGIALDKDWVKEGAADLDALRLRALGVDRDPNGGGAVPTGVGQPHRGLEAGYETLVAVRRRVREGRRVRPAEGVQGRCAPPRTGRGPAGRQDHLAAPAHDSHPPPRHPHGGGPGQRSDRRPADPVRGRRLTPGLSGPRPWPRRTAGRPG